MLVLTRKPGQGVWVNDTHVVVVEAQGSRIRLGFEPPPHTSIVRDEIANDETQAPDFFDKAMLAAQHERQRLGLPLTNKQLEDLVDAVLEAIGL